MTPPIDKPDLPSAACPAGQVLRLAGWVRLFYEEGLALIPLERGSKRPLVRWEPFRSERPTWEQLRRWFLEPQQPPNLGIICGSVSGGLIVLDFEAEADFSLVFPNRQLLDRTLVVRTPHGGVHVYLRERGEVPRRTIRLSAEHPLDLLGDGGYVVAPPSLIDHTRCEACGRVGQGLYEPISRHLRILEVKGSLGSLQKRITELGWGLRPQAPPLKEILKGVPEGMRNVSAFRYARYLIWRVGLDSSAAWHELKRWNEHNRPPLPEKELSRVFRSATRYPFKATSPREPWQALRVPRKPEVETHA